MNAKDPRAAQVISFWFANGERDARWFEKSEAFDAEVRTRFLALHEEAASGELDAWKEASGDCLALIVVLDQFPRNMFRGTARAFATDRRALEAARHAVANGYDRSMTPSQRMFVYLPFEHSESLEDQEIACRLSQPLAAFPATHDVYEYALRHREIVARFGRFPHRNAALGRASTPEEIEFLKQPGSRFWPGPNSSSRQR
jgi:uncharacterized protein (DUF924 family)